MKTTQWIMNTKLGPLYLVASDMGLQGIHWKKQTVPMIGSLKSKEKQVKILAETVRQLSEYLVGKRKSFELKLDLSGTEFQKRVWNQLLKIPYGKTVSYTDIAKKIKNDKAVRAVGSANGKNQISIIIPCHRVIAANGTLGGYSGGLQTKMRLLTLENAKK